MKDLYTETSNKADSTPMVTDLVANTVKNLYLDNEMWFRDNFSVIIREGGKITKFNALITFWNAFVVLDEELNVKGLKLDGVDLESLIDTWIKEVKAYPPYRR